MPNLSTQEITEFNKIKDELKTLWEQCKIAETQRQIPKGIDNKRVPLMQWIIECFDGVTRDNLLKIKELFNPFFESLYSSSNSDNTKTKKVTVYRKMIAEFLGEEYTKNSYNLLPYLLFQTDLEITSEVGQKDAKRVRESNRGDNRIPLTKPILKQLLNKAISDLKKPVEVSQDYMAKALALELLLGRRQYSEILNPDCFIEVEENGFFKVMGLAKGSQAKRETCFKLPYLCKEQDDIVNLIQSNLTLIREFVKEKQGKKTPLTTLLNPVFMQAMVEYDAILKPVRIKSQNMPFLAGKTHFLRKLYAFNCWVFLDKQRSNESQYFAEILVHGDKKGEDFLTDDITAKSYSIFYLDN